MSVPTDPYELLHFNMVRAHDTFKLGYDRIMKELSDVPTHDLRNFLGYCEAWATSIGEHHNSEEEIVFPFLDTKMDFSNEKQQHEIVHATLDKLLAVIHTARADPSKFNATEMKELLTNFREPLYTHLDEEVEHITSDKIQQAGFAEADIIKMIADLEAYAKAHSDIFLQVPYMRSHTPAEFKDVWPPMPWVLRKIVIPYVLARRYPGYWKYPPFPMS